jgi:hypothetical protein
MSRWLQKSLGIETVHRKLESVMIQFGPARDQANPHLPAKESSRIF